MGNRGPLPLPPEAKRVHRVGLYLNEAELESLEVKVGLPGLAELVRLRSTQRCGMREVSDLIRAKLLAHRVPVRLVVPEANQRLVADLGRVGSNVNQLAHHLNQSALTTGARANVEAVLAELAALRDALEDALLGISTRSTSITRAAARSRISTGVDFADEFLRGVQI